MQMTYEFAGRSVNRMGYGAMQLAGPGVFGPPKDRKAAIAVVRAAVEAGVDHIDTSDFYGPHITNQIIREALHPYPVDLTIVTKVGAVRNDTGAWLPASEPEDLQRGVEDNLRNLGVDTIDVVNLRITGDLHKPREGSIEPQMEALAEMKELGKIRHIGLSNATSRQVREARSIAPVVCVQNFYNLVNRADDALVDELAQERIAFVPFFPLGGFSPIKSDQLSSIAAELNVTSMQLALAWLLHRSPNILLIPGTSSLDHLTENIKAKELKLNAEILERLDSIAAS